MSALLCHRAILVGLMLLVAATAAAQNSDPFRSAAPPAAAPRPRLPPAPEPEPVIVAPQPPPPVASLPAGPFDGKYAGTRQQEGSGGHHHNGRNCPAVAPVTMTVRGGQLIFLSTNPSGDDVRFIGSVAATGEVSAVHKTSDGRDFPLAGTIRDNAFSGSFNIANCYYSFTMAKQ